MRRLFFGVVVRGRIDFWALLILSLGVLAIGDLQAQVEKAALSGTVLDGQKKRGPLGLDRDGKTDGRLAGISSIRTGQCCSGDLKAKEIVVQPSLQRRRKGSH